MPAALAAGSLHQYLPSWQACRKRHSAGQPQNECMTLCLRLAAMLCQALPHPPILKLILPLIHFHLGHWASIPSDLSIGTHCTPPYPLITSYSSSQDSSLIAPSSSLDAPFACWQIHSSFVWRDLQCLQCCCKHL